MHDHHLLNGLLLTGALLFVLGAVGFVTRRSLAVMLLAVGVMFQGVIVTLVAFSIFHGLWTGHVFALFVLAVAVVEGICGWGLMLEFVHRRGTTDIDTTHPDEETTADRESREGEDRAATDCVGDGRRDANSADTVTAPGETP